MIDDGILLEPLRPFVQKVIEALDSIPADRKEMLEKVAGDISVDLKLGKQAKLTFVCTHNSRRSHLGQVWAQVAAVYYGFKPEQVETFSGGTEATACNVRTVCSLRRAGLSIVQCTDGENPIYLVQYAEGAIPTIRAFSKIYNEGGNPTEGYIAMMCCSDVDESCPVINGATQRVPLHYRDPKEADDTEQEATRYDERSKQIAIEMFYMISLVK